MNGEDENTRNLELAVATRLCLDGLKSVRLRVIIEAVELSLIIEDCKTLACKG